MPRDCDSTEYTETGDGDIFESVTTQRVLSVAALEAAVYFVRESLGAVEELLRELRGDITESCADSLSPATQVIPRWHFAMLNDRDRNDAFAAAMERTVESGAHVLDIGSGTGLLAMMAARAGAGAVTTCEANPLLAELSRQIIARHGLSDVITVVPKMSGELRVGVDLPRKADVIVSEIVDCGLVGEGVLTTVRHARAHLLADDGVLLPRAASLVGVLVDSPAVDNLNKVGNASGFDIGLFNAVATPGHHPVRLASWVHRMLSEPARLVSFDFGADSLLDGHVVVSIPVTADGCAHGLAVWFEMELCGGVVLDNSPENRGNHWMQAWVSFPEDIRLTAGEVFAVRFSWCGGRLAAWRADAP